MDISHEFTTEAKKLLDEESKRLAEELREEALNEALRARGEPVEVTASDVRKARTFFVRRAPHLKPTTNLILRAYALLGGLMFMGGMSYPFFKKFLTESDMETQISLAVGISGLILTMMSLFMHRYFDAMHRYRMRYKSGESSIDDGPSE